MEPIRTDLDGLIAKLVGGSPLPTQKEFILSADRRAWYTGPVGCAKTTSGVAAAILPGLIYPGSEWLIARWVYWTLEQTTLAAFLDACKRLGPNVFYQPPKVGPPFEVWLNTGRNTPPSHYIFHGLDDITKLGSTKFHGVYVDECNEIDDVMAGTLDERLRRPYPHQVGVQPDGPFFWRGTSNPVTRSHWLHKKFCNEADSDPIPWGRKFKPFPRENAANLPPDYYERIAEGKSPEMKLRMIEGECGPDPAGKGVFADEFIPAVHVGNLTMYPNFPMIRGWDFGRRRPAVVWAQRVGNCVNRLLCELGENESIEKFADRILMKSRAMFPAATKWIDFCDPHGEAKRDVSDKSSCDILREKGIRVQHRDVQIITGLEQMSKGLNTWYDKRPMSMFDRAGCGDLIDGYMSGYVWPMPRPGQQMKEKPVADGYYEHLMDADRYIMVNLLLGSKNPVDTRKTNLRKIANPRTGY